MGTLLSFAGLSTGISSLVGILSSILVQFLTVVIYIFNYALYLRAFNDMPVITGTWTILRNFSNMLFIILLIWMAFATIFDSSQYSFQKMIGRFLIVAVLINFSLVIGGVIVDASQVLINVFLGAIGNPGDKLGQYLSAVKLVTSSPGAAASTYGVDAFSADTVSAIMRLILTAMFLFSLLVATFFAIIRVFIIWGLLIVSPLAWMAYILPGTQKRFYQWMGLFFGWNLFLPIYLFFLYLTLFFLSQKDQIIQQVGFKIAQDGANGLDKGLVSGLVNSTSFSLIFFYVFAAFMLSAGTLWAVQLTSAWTGVDFKKRVDSIKGLVNRLPGFSSYNSAQKAANERLKQFQKEGFRNPMLNKIYGGSDAQRRQDERWAARFGVGGSSRGQRDFVANVKKSYEILEEQYDTGQLSVSVLRQRAASANSTTPQGYALRKLALKKGALSDADLKKTLEQIKDNPYAVQDIMKTAQDAKFNGIRNVRDLALDTSLSAPSLVAAKRDMLMYVSEDGRSAAGLTAPNINTATTILGGNDSPESKKFLRNLSKHRPDLTIDYALAHPDPTAPPLVPNTLWDAAINVDAKDVTSMATAVWNRPEFQDAMRRKLGPAAGRSTAQTKLRNRFMSLLLTAPDGVAKQLIMNTQIP